MVINFFLDHDLASTNKIIPPGTKIEFTLSRANDQFYLMAEANDAEQYKAKIISCVLYCPIGIFSDRLATEIYQKWEHIPMKYYFKRLVVKSLTMPLSKSEFLSGRFFLYNQSIDNPNCSNRRFLKNEKKCFGKPFF